MGEYIMVEEKTFVMVKPDGIQRQLVGEVISRLERKGLKLIALKMMQISKEMAEKHYGVHQGKPFYQSLIKFITSGPVVASIWEGVDCINIVRKVVGATSPRDAQPGTIRGDFVIDTGYNIVHASDGPETARQEIGLFFPGTEIMDYSLSVGAWLKED